MTIRVNVLEILADGTHVCEMVTPRPGHRIRLGPREASILVEWESGGPGEPVEIEDEVARREGLV